MRTELTYAVDAMARYNGAFMAARDNVADYHKEGGLSVVYYSKVVVFMSWVELANHGQIEFVPAKWRRRLVKAMRRKMPRVHNEHSNWVLDWDNAMAGAAQARVKGQKNIARGCLRDARHIRQVYFWMTGLALR